MRAAGRDGNEWWGLATMLDGVATSLMGDIDAGRALLLEAERGHHRASPTPRPWRSRQLAYLEAHLDNWDEAARLVARARQRDRPQRTSTSTSRS